MNGTKTGPVLHLSVQFACKDPALPSRYRFRRWVQSTIAHATEVTIRLVDEDEGRQINHRYRAKDYATNVLSFPYEQSPVLLGDLVLCVPVVLREAKAQRKSAESHFAHMIVHGMLHLQGWDHEADPAEAEGMEAHEREILARLGYPDPYEASNARREY